MPIYEYECRICKERFEAVQKMSEGNEKLCCPKCNAGKPERLLSAFCSTTGKSASSGGSAHAGSGHS